MRKVIGSSNSYGALIIHCEQNQASKTNYYLLVLYGRKASVCSTKEVIDCSIKEQRFWRSISREWWRWPHIYYLSFILRFAYGHSILKDIHTFDYIMSSVVFIDNYQCQPILNFPSFLSEFTRPPSFLNYVLLPWFRKEKEIVELVKMQPITIYCTILSKIWSKKAQGSFIPHQLVTIFNPVWLQPELQ